MLQQLFGTELAFPIRVAVALGVIAALLGVTVVVMRRLAARSRAGGGRSGRPGPRIAVIDTVTLDQRRKLVLVRRDDVEHLLLIGGGSDLVIEPQIGARPVEASAGFTPAAMAPAREAPTPLQRAVPRQRLPASAPSALAAPAEAPEATETAASPPAAEPTPAEPPRRLPIGRKPLLRGDGTMSVARAPQRVAIPGKPAGEAEAAATPGVAAQALAGPQVVAPVIAPMVRDAEPARRAPAIEPRPDTRADARPDARIERPPEAAPGVAPAAEGVSLDVSAAGNRLDVMVQRLDAALKEPASPQLSLADLLGDAPEGPAVEASEGTAGPDQDRPGRFTMRPRAEPRMGVETARGRSDSLPRFERPAVAGRPETPMRPREFAFRPNPEAEKREDEGRRELPAPRDSAPRDPAPRPVEPQSREPVAREPVLRDPSPKAADSAADLRKTFDVTQRPTVELPAPEPRAPAMRADDAPAVQPAAPAPQAAVDPLDDFDAEMANLLGRSTARNR
ncbi:flagellar biosynthetic protein FliO [Xanthobacter dioxanivorans]|uniref:Flagellar biosynthetic protein FliO n=1 Tax=Xanthobacter dioxanivorans TaxID=2528964 RepID=A0A974PLV4_9HYPH|nr:flagellar biosynthetic protein FliO [Xanthobacter dioxanivorans]QRG06002.1 flagellar biosynthetic protein FliO [Xanthobacter dioxanivorans]